MSAVSEVVDSGHLFVVHGKIESVVHDAAVIPVGRERIYNPVWRSLVGETPVRPDDWDRRGWGRVHNAPDRVWAVCVGGLRPDPYDQILERIHHVLRRVDERRDVYEKKRPGHSLPLVAVPVVGIGYGGYGEQMGDVLTQLVAGLAEWARELNVDVALVTPDPAVYAAAQYARRHVVEELPPRLEQVAEQLAGQAKGGGLALLLGAGVGRAAGLPTWHELIQRLAEEFGVEGVTGGASTLTTTDQAELIEKSANGRFQHRVAALTRTPDRPSLLHALLAGLDCHEVVTTNYDVMYETAVSATGRDITSVMPWSSAQGAERWILKLHGDVDHVERIVLTRRHMVVFDAANRPSAAVLQSLLLTKRLLIVGTSMTDDNVVRLAHEVQAYREVHQGGGSGTFGTVLDVGSDHIRSRLWDGQLDWVMLGEAGPWTGTRAVELLLDRVALLASRDSSWLLDRRFGGLIDSDEERRLVQEVRRAYEQMPQRAGTKWWPLVQQLRELGVDSGADWRV